MPNTTLTVSSPTWFTNPGDNNGAASWLEVYGEAGTSWILVPAAGCALSDLPSVAVSVLSCQGRTGAGCSNPQDEGARGTGYSYPYLKKSAGAGQGYQGSVMASKYWAGAVGTTGWSGASSYGTMSWSGTVAELNDCYAYCNGAGYAHEYGLRNHFFVDGADYYVEYAIPGGGFAFLVAELLGPVLGGALTLRDILGLRTMLADSRITGRKRNPVTGDPFAACRLTWGETAQMYRELREHRYPRTFDMKQTPSGLLVAA